MFQQDSAPAHQVCETIELLECETPDFISPDLWTALTSFQSITSFGGHATVGLSDDVQECGWTQEATGWIWIGLEQNIIHTAIDEWRNHLRAYVRAKGQNFEHLGLLYQSVCRQLNNWTIW